LRASLERSENARKQQIADAVTETERLSARQERLRKNLGAGGHNEQSAQWRLDLGAAESRINELEERTIAALRDDERCIREDLRQALISLSADWQSR
jgi:hypothetical protein